MRIPCCHCGERGHEEFTYLGDATVQRPDQDRSSGERGQTHGSDPTATAPMLDYVYLRDNPAGPHRELWHHTSGCRAWLVVTRNTRTHAIEAVQSARAIALARDGT